MKTDSETMPPPQPLVTRHETRVVLSLDQPPRFHVSVTKWFTSFRYKRRLVTLPTSHFNFISHLNSSNFRVSFLKSRSRYPPFLSLFSFTFLVFRLIFCLFIWNYLTQVLINFLFLRSGMFSLFVLCYDRSNRSFIRSSFGFIFYYGFDDSSITPWFDSHLSLEKKICRSKDL